MHIWYTFIIALTAVGSSYVTYNLPALKRGFKRFLTPTKPAVDATTYFELTSRINDLEQQVNNLAETLASRDKHRRNNIRKDVREYLKEMADGKYDE